MTQCDIIMRWQICNVQDKVRTKWHADYIHSLTLPTVALSLNINYDATILHYKKLWNSNILLLFSLRLRVFLLILLRVLFHVEVVESLVPSSWSPGLKEISNRWWYPSFDIILEEDCHASGGGIILVWTNDVSRKDCLTSRGKETQINSHTRTHAHTHTHTRTHACTHTHTHTHTPHLPGLWWLTRMLRIFKHAVPDTSWIISPDCSHLDNVPVWDGWGHFSHPDIGRGKYIHVYTVIMTR